MKINNQEKKVTLMFLLTIEITCLVGWSCVLIMSFNSFWILCYSTSESFVKFPVQMLN